MPAETPTDANATTGPDLGEDCTHPNCERHGKSPCEGVGCDGMTNEERATRPAPPQAPTSTEPPRIVEGDIFYFDGLPGTIPGPSPTEAHATRGGLVQVYGITWVGDLLLARGVLSADGTPTFEGRHASVRLTDAHALIVTGIWRHYRTYP